MGLASCDGCWDDACCCADGRGWLRYSREDLLSIKAAIEAALAAQPACGEPLPGGVPCRRWFGHLGGHFGREEAGYVKAGDHG